MVLGVLISVTELAKGSIVALEHQMAVFGVVNALVDGPESVNLSEIIEVHPEDTIIASSIKSNLSSEFLCPEWGRI